ncbi:MAG: BRCT domain-containing protein, partial [Pirellulales bacterium]
RLLGFDQAKLDSVIDLARGRTGERKTNLGDSYQLLGKRVCFTGTSICCRNGQPISRETAERLVVAAGLVVAPSVTKALEILVVADPNTLSGKAQKARRYGTRIIAEPVFWRTIGVPVD